MMMMMIVMVKTMILVVMMLLLMVMMMMMVMMMVKHHGSQAGALGGLLCFWGLLGLRSFLRGVTARMPWLMASLCWLLLALLLPQAQEKHPNLATQSLKRTPARNPQRPRLLGGPRGSLWRSSESWRSASGQMNWNIWSCNRSPIWDAECSEGDNSRNGNKLWRSNPDGSGMQRSRSRTMAQAWRTWSSRRTPCEPCSGICRAFGGTKCRLHTLTSPSDSWEAARQPSQRAFAMLPGGRPCRRPIEVYGLTAGGSGSSRFVPHRQLPEGRPFSRRPVHWRSRLHREQRFQWPTPGLPALAFSLLSRWSPLAVCFPKSPQTPPHRRQRGVELRRAHTSTHRCQQHGSH